MLTCLPRRPNTRRTALFWIRWSLAIKVHGRPYNKLLLASILDVTNACTNLSAVWRSIYLRICPILWRARDAERHTLLTCNERVMYFVHLCTKISCFRGSDNIWISNSDRRQRHLALFKPRGKMQDLRFCVIEKKFVFSSPLFDTTDALFEAIELVINACIMRIEN